jgi:hypothetical protein
MLLHAVDLPVLCEFTSHVQPTLQHGREHLERTVYATQLTDIVNALKTLQRSFTRAKRAKLSFAQYSLIYC